MCIRDRLCIGWNRTECSGSFLFLLFLFRSFYADIPLHPGIPGEFEWTHYKVLTAQWYSRLVSEHTTGYWQPTSVPGEFEWTDYRVLTAHRYTRWFWVNTLQGHHHHHQSLNREGRWGTTDDFSTSFLHFSLFSTALWDFPNSRPVHSLVLFQIL